MIQHFNPADITVMLLAAGHGKRMLPLTQNTPKPLLKVAGLSLIEHHLKRLANLGFQHIVINIAHLGEQIPAQLGDGSAYQLHIDYSDEHDTGALETAGGIKYALGLIQSDPFMVVNADIWTDFDFSQCLAPLHGDARLVMVANPAHHQTGDFVLDKSGMLSKPTSNNTLTFSGIALYRRQVFESLAQGKLALAPVLNTLIQKQRVEGLHYQGQWFDIGTPERLQHLNSLNQA